MIPKIIHHVWMGGPMPDKLRAYVNSARLLHPEWSHFFWDKMPIEQNTPGLSSPAAMSNYVRLVALYDYGGISLDTDVECLKPFDSLLKERAFAAFQDDTRICNAVMGSEWHHPWIGWQINQALKRLTNDAATGVYLATDAPREGLTLIDRHLIYPWSYDSPPELRKPHPDSFCAHHWEGSWTK